eukprot:GFUD01021387.1.p1 GENE.GFUD01021387.1~~GFUD01021387.1.p1  ORF type:complete len:369 (+),score=127.36 GFUD01021387.1:2-1108(+)
MDPDYVPSTDESQDSLEYRSETEQEESLDVDCDMEWPEVEDCPDTVWPALFSLVGKVTEEDSEIDLDYVPSTEESQDSLEYRSETEHEESQDVYSDIDLEDCPDTVWPALFSLVEEVTEEDSEVDPDYVPSTEESQDSLEYRSETESEHEESLDLDSDMKEWEDCPNTVWPALLCLVEEVTDEEDSEIDPDYVPSTEESQDSVEYRSETESEQEGSQDMEELEDCPTTPNCVMVEHKIGKISEKSEEGSSHDESQDKDVVEEVEVVVAYGIDVEDVLEKEFEEITEVECRTPQCVKDEHEGRRLQQEEVFPIEKEGLAYGIDVEDVLEKEFEEISEVECRTPQCVKDEHEGRRLQQKEVFPIEKEENP